jgi:carbon monoxide dehydrogenase subunit G
MDISGSHQIPAPRASVWAGLHDPAVLKECIPGCERLEQVADDVFEGVVAAKVGPLRTNFAGRVTVTSSNAPERCEIVARGEDAAAGSGEGRGAITLSEEDGGTRLDYAGAAEVEGKLAQLGSRLVSGVARQTVETFFTRFATLAAEGRLPEGGALAEPPLAEAPPLAPDQPASAPAEVADAPSLAAAGVAPEIGVPPPGPAPIAPTATPDIPDPAAIAAAEAADPAERGAMTRIMLIAAIVAVAGVAVYFFLLQPPPA